MLKLPKESIAPVTLEPRFMLLAGNKKGGKTSACLQLPNSLLIDLEDGASIFGGMYLNLVKELQEIRQTDKNKGLGSLYMDYAKEISNANLENKKPIYDFIIIDNTSVLGELASGLALVMYKSTPLGKNFQGTDVTTLPKGAGWNWYKKAFLTLAYAYKSLAGKCVILLSHTKNTELSVSGYGEFHILDLEITGSSKHAILSDTDTQGVLFRSKDKTEDGKLQNIITFRSRDDGDIMGCRIPYLANKDIVISDFDPETYELRTYWERIFPSIKN